MLKLSNEEKEYINSFINNFSISSASSILEFGKIIEDRVGSLSNIVFNNTKAKDNSEIEIIIKDILDELDKINYKPKKLSFIKILLGYTEETPKKPNYDLMLLNIDKLVIELKKHIITLQKDLHLITLLDENSEEYLHELDMYLHAGKLALEKANEEAKVLQSKKKDLEYNDQINAISNFEKRIHDLELLRMICVQSLPQIDLIKNNNYLVIDRINYLINSTVPLWKSQILILMSNQNEKDLLSKNKEISEMMNKLLLDNASSLKDMTFSTKEELTSGYVSSKTLTETTKMILSSLDNLEKFDNIEEKKEKNEVLTLK